MIELHHLTVIDLSKSFGTVQALKNISFSIVKGELFSILGPSGCGKTTLLRCIAGLETPDSGRIIVEDKNITMLPPNKRDNGFVFQNYALFPTMTVAQNIAFGLQMRKIPHTEIQKRVGEILEIVGLKGYESRKPKQLSGGQQQRVALARAMVIQPRIMLFDEPLSNLDAKLRVEMRSEIRRILGNSGITSIYVTHDQEEAFALSNKVMLLKDGIIQQIGSPQELYFSPLTSFIASFIGGSNILEGKLQKTQDQFVTVEVYGRVLRLGNRYRRKLKPKVKFSIHPEQITLNSKDSDNYLEGFVRHVEVLGSVVRLFVKLQDREIIVKNQVTNEEGLKKLPRVNETVRIRFNSEDAVILED